MRNTIDLNKKGISSALAAVLIATISITLVGTSYFFSKGVIEKGIAETFEVIDIFGNRVIVRNTGTQPISEFKTLIDGNEVENEIENPPIQPKSLGTINVSLEGISPGRHQLTLISKSMSQTWTWDFEYVVTTPTAPQPSLQQASIEAIVGTEQGEAEIGKPVKWTSNISFNNPSEIDIINYKSSVLLPKDAINIVIKDPDRQILAKNTNSWAVSVSERSNMSYSIEFETPAPYKEESVIDTVGLRKRIKVNSDASLHYENVRVSTEVSENAANQRLYLVKDDTRIDVTNNPSYNVSFVDIDGNGIIDRIEWVVPELSEIIFETQGETPWLNVTLLTPVTYLCNETYPCDWDQYSEQWINASVECIDGYCGEVTAYARYNNSGTSMTMISTTVDDQPFYVTYPTTGDPDNSWYNVTSNDPAYIPPTRYRSSMVYDSKNDRIIMFGGGQRSVGGQLNDTWVFNYSDEKWYNVTKEGSPPIRYKHAMTYDSKNDRTILFGGDDVKGVEQNDTWVFNYTDLKWYNVTPDGSPPPRFYPTMVYDSGNDATILFGGTPDGYTMFNDTWVFNYSDEIGWKWYNITPDKSPRGREMYYMSYDSDNKATILFGGYIYPDVEPQDYLNDTWVLNYSNEDGWKWYEIISDDSPVDSPSERYGHTMAYDSESKLTILFGGYGDVTNHNDTWVFNYTDQKWYNVTTTGPSVRRWHSMAYDSKHDRTILFGGYYNSQDTNRSDTWVLNYTFGGVGNPLSCGSLSSGDSCQLNWTVKVTGSPGEVYRLDVNFSSNLPNVDNNDTSDAYIRISYLPLRFEIKLPGKTPVSSSGTESGNPTTPIEFNASSKTETVEPCVWDTFCSLRQTSLIPIFNFTNTGNVAEQWNISYTGTLPSDADLYGNTIYDYLTAIQITPSGWIPNNNIQPGGYQEVWLWADFVDAPPDFVEVTINHTSMPA